MKYFYILAVICLLCSCTQIPYGSLSSEQNVSSRNALYAWNLQWDKNKLQVSIDGDEIQLYPTIKVGNLELRTTGISNTGPAANDFGLKLEKDGYLSAPLKVRFENKQQLKVFILREDQSPIGKLLLETTYSFSKNKLEIEQKIINPQDQDREFQLLYLVKDTQFKTSTQTYKNLQFASIDFFSQEEMYCDRIDPNHISIGTSLYQTRTKERQNARVPIVHKNSHAKLTHQLTWK